MTKFNVQVTIQDRTKSYADRYQIKTYRVTAANEQAAIAHLTKKLGAENVAKISARIAK